MPTVGFVVWAVELVDVVVDEGVVADGCVVVVVPLGDVVFVFVVVVEVPLVGVGAGAGGGVVVVCAATATGMSNGL